MKLKTHVLVGSMFEPLDPNLTHSKGLMMMAFFIAIYS
jgi:hypothetical protein